MIEEIRTLDKKILTLGKGFKSKGFSAKDLEGLLTELDTVKYHLADLTHTVGLAHASADAVEKEAEAEQQARDAEASGEEQN